MSVPWETIRQYVEECYEIKGHVERSSTLRFAEYCRSQLLEGISDDPLSFWHGFRGMDAIDAIGSRVFRGENAVADVKEFLVEEGHITPEICCFETH